MTLRDGGRNYRRGRGARVTRDADLQVCRELSARARGKGGGRKPSPPLDTFRPHVMAVLNKAGGPVPSGVLHERIAEAVPGGMGEKRVRALVAECLFAGVIAKTGRAHEPGGGVLIGTPEQIEGHRKPKMPLDGEQAE